MTDNIDNEIKYRAESMRRQLQYCNITATRILVSPDDATRLKASRDSYLSPEGHHMFSGFIVVVDYSLPAGRIMLA